MNNVPARVDEHGLRPYQRMGKELAELAVLDAPDSVDIAAQAIDQIAQAETLEDILAANESGLASAEDYIGVPLNITGLTWRPSDAKYQKGTLGSVYTVIDALLDNGEPITLSTGAPNVVASLRQAQKLGLIRDDEPLRVQITEKTTANGVLYRLGRAT